MALGEDHVRVSWLPTTQVAAAAWPRLLDLLDEPERQRADRFHFERDRQCYVAAHALLRGTLSRLATATSAGAPPGTSPVAPRDWRFTVDGYGKPELIPRPGQPRLRVNLSHTRGLAAVAVTLERDVGIDVEWTERGTLTLDLADRFFAPAECAALAVLEPHRTKEALFAFWTLKEAYIKAVGLGLSLPLDAFAFTLDPLGIAFSERIADRPQDWYFRRFRPGPEHAMALAVRQGSGPVTVSAEPADLEALLQAGTTPGAAAGDQGRIWRR